MPPPVPMAEPRPPACRPGRRVAPWFALVALLLALALPGVHAAPSSAAAAATAPPPAAASEAPATVWVEIEGRRVLELRRVAGAQKPQDVAARASQQVRQMAGNHRIDPAWLTVREDPPYSMIGLENPGGSFQPLLAVDDRAAAAFGLERPVLAERYRDQLRGAIRQYRTTHSLSAWLRGTALALAVL